MKKAVKVEALPNYDIKVWYQDGKCFRYNVKQDVDSLKAFAHLRDEEQFKKVYLQYTGYAIAWGDGDEWEDVTMSTEVPYYEGEQLLSASG